MTAGSVSAARAASGRPSRDARRAPAPPRAAARMPRRDVRVSVSIAMSGPSLHSIGTGDAGMPSGRDGMGSGSAPSGRSDSVSFLIAGLCRSRPDSRSTRRRLEDRRADRQSASFPRRCVRPVLRASATCDNGSGGPGSAGRSPDPIGRGSNRGLALGRSGPRRRSLGRRNGHERRQVALREEESAPLDFEFEELVLEAGVAGSLRLA